MKKFVFDLQDILDIRKFEQQQAEIELGKALGVENEIQQKLNALAVRQASIQKTMKGSTDFNDIASANQFYSYVRTSSEELMNQMAQAKLITEQKRKILKECMKKTDALESLKESEEQEFNQELKRQEAKQIDDIVTGRFNI